MKPHPQQDLIIDLIKSGKQIAEIRQIVKCGQTTVYTFMRKLGIKPSSPPPTGVKRHNWDAVQTAYDAGKSRKHCEDEFEISPDLWSRACREGKIHPHEGDSPKTLEDLTGRQFGDWTVLGRAIESDRADGRHWKCRCVCGKTLTKTTVQITQDSKSCGCRKLRYGKDSPRWEGYGEIPMTMWRSIILSNDSRSRPFPFKITIEDAWNLFLTQNRRCAISGVELTFGKSQKANKTASLDRIDSTRGYEIGNIQWVHKDVNIMKLDHSSENFLAWVAKIYEHNHLQSRAA